MSDSSRDGETMAAPVVAGAVIALLLGVGLLGSGLARGASDPPATASDRSVAPTQTKASTPSAGQVWNSRTSRRETDNWTFRPTVLIRRGNSQGSGTIIASVDGETLIATAAHVIRAAGPVTVELHRYNLGVEHRPQAAGLWPRLVNAELVASDLSADVAILRIRKMVALPYTARLSPEAVEPGTRARLTSVGIDLGSKLSSWDTNFENVLWFELNDSGSDRPFLITTQIPEHGRSGGGLYDSKGRLVAVCVGHAEVDRGRKGIFSSVENVRQLLNANELTSVVARSEARHDRLFSRGADPGSQVGRAARPAVTPTEASQADGRP